MYWHEKMETNKIITWWFFLSPVWYNSMISKNSLFIKYWYKKGVNTDNDFLDNKDVFKNKLNIIQSSCMYNAIY